MLCTMGFLNACRIGLRIRRKGLMMKGLPCNSHSFMSSSVHKRSAELPYGNEESALVVNGNMLAYRSTLLILLATVRSVAWFVENPSGSKCLLLPAFAKLLELRGLLGSTTCNWLGLQFCEETRMHCEPKAFPLLIYKVAQTQWLTMHACMLCLSGCHSHMWSNHPYHSN